METVFTGIKPTNALHIGNIFGSINLFSTFANANIILFIPDLHALTTQTHISKDSIYNILRYYMVFMPNALYYIQSQHTYICKLQWILSCNVSVSMLERMTQYKDKTQKGSNSNCGLLSYPVLMAADILSINASVIPVGEDQVQHLEMTRYIAREFNKKYKTNIFTIPQAFVLPQKRIYDLQIPTQKMSKSSDSDKGTIFVTDTPEQITRKIQKAQTDMLNMPSTIEELTNRHAIRNLLNIYCLCTNENLSTVIDLFANQQISKFKQALSNVLSTYIVNLQTKAALITNEHIDVVLHNSYRHVAEIFDKQATMINELIYN